MVKIGIFGLENIFSGSKVNIVDKRLDRLKELLNAPKKVYVQAELIYGQAPLDIASAGGRGARSLTAQAKFSEADGIIIDENSKLDLILADLEFVETRLNRAEDEEEKRLLHKFKAILEKEEFLYAQELTDAEKKISSSFQLLSISPVYPVDIKKESDKDSILSKAYGEFGYISFFTSNDKETHAWPLKKGMTALDAAGVIHSDIQKGFIRAEVVHYDDLIKSGHLSSARAAGLLKSENKEYVVLDGDWVLFRFSK